ncbi:snRNA-activating protein complex subunit 4 homolog [Tigriopus californicus]|uniref:snRNA-activating protein complex subunit 4 homolog n=1 Tax=Tigriopus californicus TaxID=6832 RepID=UPI0027DA42D5|nr:snRNA-activating protein complex subunit 4 homolog [Tigriopus californicus]
MDSNPSQAWSSPSEHSQPWTDPAAANEVLDIKPMAQVTVPMSAAQASSVMIQFNPLDESSTPSEPTPRVPMMEPLQAEEFPFGDFQFSDAQSDTLYVPSQTSQMGSTCFSEYTTMESESTTEPRNRFDDNETQMLNMDEIEEGDIPISYHNALILNETYQNSVLEAIEILNVALERNHSRQEELTFELGELQKGNVTARVQSNLGLNDKRQMNVFSAPYFKDERLFSHPPNRDSIRKKANRELDPYLTNPKEWTHTEKKSLLLAVKEDALREKMSRPMAHWEHLLGESEKKNLKPERKTQLLMDLREAKREIERIKCLSEDELFHNREEDFDWMRISVQAFQGMISPKSCELMWKNMLHPTINRASWTQEEDNLLKHLADTHHRMDWDLIARELGTNRTGFLCCMRYQLKYNQAFEKRRWTVGEDRRLKQLVAKCRINNFIPWTKVAYYMEGKTKDQCYQRYFFSLTDGLRTGAFSESEDFLIYAAVKLFGEQWRLISDYIPFRNASQILARYQNVLSADLRSWKKEDDQRLLEAVKELGTKDWVKVAERTPGKSRLRCRTRFFAIYKQFIKDPNKFNLGHGRVPRQVTARRQEKLFHRWKICLEEFLDKYRDIQGLPDQVESPSASEPKSGFRTTPEGVKIPIDAVEKFMRDLSTELRYKDVISSVTEPMRKPTVPSCEVLGMVASQPKSMIVVQNRLGRKTVQAKRGVGRPLVPLEMQRGTLAKRMKTGLALFMRPSWDIRRPSRRFRVITEEEYGRFGQAMFNMGKVLRCNQSLDFNRTIPENTMDPPDEHMELVLEHYRHLIDGGKLPVVSNESVVGPPSPKRSKKRTYGRKTPNLVTPKSSGQEEQSTSASTSSKGNPNGLPDLTILPPNLATLVGFRGMSLYNRYLQKRAAPEENVSLNVDFKSLITGGIYHPDVIMSAAKFESAPSTSVSDIPVESSNTDADAIESEADQLLFQRFKALFLWPAIMASLKIPFDLSAKDNLFGSLNEDSVNANLGDSRPLSAENPFDPTEIIEQSSQSPPTRKVRVINRPKTKATPRPKPTKKRTRDEVNQSEDKSSIDLK